MPALDGSSLTSVSAASVGGVSAAAVASGIAAVQAATTSNTASTLVARDASGNFLAGTITATLNGNASSASFATGKAGTAAFQSNTLVLNGDGSYFDVNGTTAINALSSMPLGAIVTLHFANQLTLNHDPAVLQLGGKGPFTTSASGSDLFQFLSLGNGSWRELARSVTADSEVYYTLKNTDSITFPASTAQVNLSYSNSLVDNQLEWTPATATFRPKQSGLYAFNVGFETAALASSGGGCLIQMSYNGVNSRNYSYTSAANANCAVFLSGTISFSAGTAVQVTGGIFSQSSSAAINPAANATGSYVHFTRIRN